MTSGARFTGKVAIVTGGGQGIGEACCEIFSREGAKVVVADIDRTVGEATAARLRAEGGEADFVYADVTDPKSVADVVAGVVARHGRLDILVNNAGGGGGNVFDVLEMTLDDWERSLRLNLTGPWLMTVEAARRMKAQGGGVIVNVASMAAFRHSHTTNPAYAVAKAGVVNLTKLSAARLAADNIRVNCVAPGMTLTRLLRGLGEETMAEIAATHAALPRVSQPSEQASAVAYLCSDEAGYVTGHTIRVDGGWSAL